MSNKQIKTNIEATMFVISALKYHVQIPEHECLIAGTMALRKNHDILARKLTLMQGVLKASLTLSEKVKPMVEALMLAIDSNSFDEHEITEDLERLIDGKGFKFTKIRSKKK